MAAVREHVWPLIEAGHVKPIVHKTFPLARNISGLTLRAIKSPISLFDGQMSRR